MSIGLYRTRIINPFRWCIVGGSNHKKHGAVIHHHLDAVVYCYGFAIVLVAEQWTAGSREAPFRTSWAGRSIVPGSKLQAPSFKRLIHSPVNNYDFKFDLYRMILYMYTCQLHGICCWFSLYSCNVSVGRV